MGKAAILLILIALVAGFFFWNKKTPSESPQPQASNQTEGSTSQEQILATGLKVPWELAFLSDGEILIAERPGTIKLLSKDGNIKDVTKVGVAATGEGGLLGLVLHPEFAKNHLLYVYFTYEEGKELYNKVERHKFENNQFSFDKLILEKIPGNSNHNGGRMKFGPDKKLYITTGDAQERPSSQDTSSLAGKILRLNDDGAIPSDNPFNSPVYSYGHRNPQGLAWDKEGKLWETEHGNSAYDEVNIIEKGKNYGWPDYRADQIVDGITSPFVQSGTDTWAPSGAEIKDDTFYFSGLRGQAIFSVNTKTKETKEYFKGKYGRIRVITLGPDGYFYILTNNTDGRGFPKSGDDKLIKIPTSLLE